MRKNILIFGHDYAPQFVDIYNQYTKLFAKDEYEVTVVYLTGEPSEDVQSRTIAENVIFLNMPKKNIRSLKIKAIRKMLALTREKNFALAICHRYKPTFIMMWVNRFHKIPGMISVMHELGTMKSIKRQLTIAALAPKSMLFAGVSNAVRDNMRKDLWCVPGSRVITLYNMVDVDLTEPKLYSRTDARQKLNLADDDFVFGNLGRLVVNKDQTSLIHAFSIIKPYCPNAKLILIGSGDLENQLKQQVKTYNLTDSVIFTGFLSGGFRYMKAFDCFVLSSIQEAFGRVLLEAMIAKLPIIATRVHGIPEVIDNTGLLVDPKDPINLATSMQTIYEASEDRRETLGEKAYQRAVKKFSIPVFYSQFWGLDQMRYLRKKVESI